ncbi:MAG: hypothetical protein M3N13_01855, partial [Candidatus Eremiobacteraeota bacterium]|nr:hypothetical protein [Candidatus Eremiobacteraeota bacterium]
VLCGIATTITNNNGVRTIERGETVCSDLSGASLAGAKMRHIQRCSWEGYGNAKTCSEVSAQTLRDVAHANLSGVIL